ncbi:fungal-specific transcription factor domain-containing protein [Penicillium concentricum]|uniref:Fungal-specific transcription factor domain-containing protein n=1 Tax=Penicillium concentricum TaxID=293559 RepID=A0A9W9RUD4_9EURO|nr:fungal-specific transcription factor domain-containing protein [Penicillium concentricum]KAJ5365459.1 fungal-specific transcription factor domain-containing protein [Penicillium concentricum]
MGRVDFLTFGRIWNSGRPPPSPETLQHHLITYHDFTIVSFCGIMNPDGIKIAKACEPCRRRKIKCDGLEPCRNCPNQPTACIYRRKARVRLRRSGTQTTVNSVNCSSDPINATAGPKTANGASLSPYVLEAQHSRAEVYDSVAAAHHAPQFTDSSQLFYGPSSNFAFLQQVHRAILSHGPYGKGCGSGFEEGGSGLDMFMQRNVFFGVPLRANLGAAQLGDLHDGIIPRHLATVYLDNFKIASLHILPFFTTEDLDILLHSFYSARADITLHPQRRALLLMVLAIGALSTTETQLADTLFLQAKLETTIYEDAVTLPMIQFSLLSADYQLNIGRPNSAYLHVGVACRKTFALGLHTVAGNSLTQRAEHIQERHATLWCLYFYETFVALTVGRKSTIRVADVACPYPDGRPVLVDLCRLAAIIEEAAELIYSHKASSLRNLYTTAQSLHTRLQQCAERFGLGSVTTAQKGTTAEVMAILTLHNVAESALRCADSTQQTGDMWLRQACRNATDAAADSIAFVDAMFRTIDVSKVRRYDAFFIEASCSVLLHNSLQHPSKHPNNLVYIHMALGCLQSMTNGEPVTNVARSIQRIVSAVENSISQVNLTPTLIPSPSDESPPVNANIKFPSLENTSSCATTDYIFLSDKQSRFPSNLSSDGPRLSRTTADPLSQQLPQLNLDILTTDLFSYFQLDPNMESQPSDT